MRITPPPTLGLGFSTALISLLPQAAEAHSFGQSYTLPVPLTFYAWGSVAALALSFVIAALVLLRQGSQASRPSPSISWQLPKGLDIGLGLVLRLLGLSLLSVAIVAGFIGHPNAYANINMTLFWIVFVLAYAYSCALLGGTYTIANPWRNLSLLLLPVKAMRNGLFQYPFKLLGYWPALLLYMGFIWLELFGETKPRSLAEWLIIYSAINLFGAMVWGVKSWFRYGEFFSVFLRLISLCAPLYYAQGKLTLRWPFSGLLDHKADHYSLLLFILFMLSSTAFDGLHESRPWQRLFWSELLPLLDPEVLKVGLRAIITHRSWYYSFQWSSLLLSPWLYLAAYWLALWLGKKLAGSTLPLPALALQFAYSLLPIALVYHISHYYTLLQTQGVKVIPMLSDPFNMGWNLFGSASWFQYSIIPDVAKVWHVQVATIVIGHIVSVYIAHIQAVRIFDNHRQATLSQIPMLVLMMLFTSAGLWILAQPIQTGL